MSSGDPPRLSGIPLRHPCTTSSGKLPVISVSIKPGAITFERMFRDPNSKAIDFENPIILLTAKIVKKQAHSFVKKIVSLLSIDQINRLVEEIEERTIDSRFHMRLGKQELIKGSLVIKEKDTIKIKIHTPIYNKKDTIKSFTEIFQIVN